MPLKIPSILDPMSALGSKSFLRKTTGGVIASTADPKYATPKTPDGEKAYNEAYGLGAGALQAQIDLAPAQYDAEARYGPMYDQLALQSLRSTYLGSPDYLAYFRTPEVQAGYANAVAGGETWSPEEYAKNYYANIGRPAGVALPTSGGLLDVYRQSTPELGSIQAAANTQSRQADIGDVAAMGGQVYGLQRQFNPELYANLDRLSAMAGQGTNIREVTANTGYQPVTAPGSARDVYASAVQSPSMDYLTALTGQRAATAGIGGIQGELERQARRELALGRNLSGTETRDAQQSVRAAFQARGLGGANVGVSEEVLNLDRVAREREAARRAFAQGVDATGFNQRQAVQNQLAQAAGLQQYYAGLGMQGALANQSIGLEAQRSNQQADLTRAGYDLAAQQSNQAAGLEGNRLSLQAQLANQGRDANVAQLDWARAQGAAGAWQAQMFDPFQGVLGRSSQTPGTAMASTQQTQQLNDSAGPTLFDPYDSSLMSIYAGNEANATASGVAKKNASSAKTGAVVSGIASIGSAYILAAAL